MLNKGFNLPELNDSFVVKVFQHFVIFSVWSDHLKFGKLLMQMAVCVRLGIYNGIYKKSIAPLAISLIFICKVAETVFSISCYISTLTVRSGDRKSAS